jgi:hypothetical protein
VLLRRLLLLLLLLLDCLIQLLLQLLLLLVVQLLVLLARTPSIQLRGRTAGCLLQLLTSTVPRADVRGATRRRWRRLVHGRLSHRSSPKKITVIACRLLICAGCSETRDAAKALPTNLCAGPSAVQV